MKLKTDLWNFQHEAVQQAKDKFFFHMAMGTGKTLCSMKAMSQRDAKRVLVLGPKNALRSVTSEVRKHAEKPPDLAYFPEETIKDRVRDMHEVYKEGNEAWFFVNYTALDYNEMLDYLDWVDWDGVIGDEIHRLKNPRSKRSNSLIPITRNVPFKFGLTGTPIPNGYEDLFSQFRLINYRVFGASWKSFKRKYCIEEEDHFGKSIVDYKNTDELERKLHEHSVRISDDVQDLPETTDLYRYGRLGAQNQRKHKELWRRFNDARTKEQALGYLTTMQRLLSDMKEDLFKDVLLDLPDDEPLVVFARYHDDLDRVMGVLDSCGELSGRQDDYEAFAEGEYNHLAVQIQAGAEGLNKLTRARYCIFYNMTHNWGNYRQARKRVHRPGQNRQVVYIHLVGENTIEEKMLESLNRKENLVDSIL